MSDTVTPAPVPPVITSTEPSWAKPAVALGSLIVFVAMLVVAYLTKNQDMMTLLGGAAVAMATQAGNYYLGSSSGSAHKTALLAAAPPIVAPPAQPK